MLRGDFSTTFRHLKSGYKGDGDSLLTRGQMEKAGRLQLDMRTITHNKDNQLLE